MNIALYAAFCFFPILMAYAAASDLLTMTISNWVSIALVAGFVALAPLVPGMTLTAFGFHLAGGAVVLIVTFAMFSFGWIGGGDAKIAAAASLWLGLDHTVEFLTWTAVIGGPLTILVLVMRQGLSPALAVRFTWLHRLHDPSSGVPYGLALAAAALFVYPDTVWMNFVAS